jgi:hypothetical protein
MGNDTSALGRAERFLVSTAGVALWLVLGEPVFFYRSRGPGSPYIYEGRTVRVEQADHDYHLVEMVCLGAVLYFVPGQIVPPRQAPPHLSLSRYRHC